VRPSTAPGPALAGFILPPFHTPPAPSATLSP
jgi:hypothetical protein